MASASGYETVCASAPFLAILSQTPEEDACSAASHDSQAAVDSKLRTGRLSLAMQAVNHGRARRGPAGARRWQVSRVDSRERHCAGKPVRWPMDVPLVLL